ncbi:MAG: hypothetical protein LN588_02145 [Rickettsia endosymbiont of Bryobia graminum]|nr:hypothetical protein [Rickettsia endosymbiont of Bryobia graminum]
MLSYREECETCTKVALTIIELSIIGPVSLVLLITKCSFSIIKNYYYSTNSPSLLPDSTEENNEEWFEVTATSDSYDFIAKEL